MPTNFDSYGADSHLGDDPYQPGTQIILQYLRAAGAQSIADIGCGDAGITRTLASDMSHAGTVFAVDVDPRVAQALTSTPNPIESDAPIVVVTQDVYDLTLPGTVDAIICRFLLIDLADPLKAVASMYRSVKPGGLLILAEPITSTGRVGRDVLASDASEIKDADVGLELADLLTTVGSTDLSMRAITPVGLGSSSVGQYLGAMTGADPDPMSLVVLPTLLIAVGNVPDPQPLTAVTR